MRYAKYISFKTQGLLKVKLRATTNLSSQGQLWKYTILCVIFFLHLLGFMVSVCYWFPFQHGAVAQSSCPLRHMLLCPCSSFALVRDTLASIFMAENETKINKNSNWIHHCSVENLILSSIYIKKRI